MPLKTKFIIVAIVAVLIGSLVQRNAQMHMNEEATEALIGVHVKGAVVNEGYYEVPIGVRVNELGDFVGGFLPETDLDSVNLAAFVKDGEEVYFPFKATGENGGINLNSATKEEFMTVEGIGETLADKIVAYREEHGGFKKVSELRAILGESTYKKVCEKLYT